MAVWTVDCLVVVTVVLKVGLTAVEWVDWKVVEMVYLLDEKTVVEKAGWRDEHWVDVMAVMLVIRMEPKEMKMAVKLVELESLLDKNLADKKAERMVFLKAVCLAVWKVVCLVDWRVVEKADLLVDEMVVEMVVMKDG